MLTAVQPDEVHPAQPTVPSPLLSAVLAVVQPSASADDVAARLAVAGAPIETATAARLLGQLAQLGLVRVARNEPAGPTFVATTLGRSAIETGLTGDAAAPLEELEALRSDLVSTIAHELRTPLTAIRTSIGLLNDPQMEPTDEQRDTLLRSIERNADRMQRLIADILDLSRFRAGTVSLQLRPLRSVALARGAVSAVGPLAFQRGVTVALEARVDDDHEVYGDRRRLEQALINLLSNAVRFSPPQESVSVIVEARGEQTAWSVVDRGPGISTGDQARLFERFFVGRSDSSGDGVGLGLPTALAIAQAHAGTIEVDSEIGRGSTFTLLVPTAGPEEPAG
jgi:signal transduction histidine kinase